MKNHIGFSFFVLFFLARLLPTYAQINTSEASYFYTFDNSIGIKNSNLYSGVYYDQKYLMDSDNHLFFKSFEFLNGHIVYGGQQYYNVKIRYNILEDKILVKSPSEILIELNSINIKEVIIDNHKFRRLYNTNLKADILGGFYEVLEENPFFTLYAKHKKKAIKKSNGKVYVTIFKESTSYILNYNNNYYQIKSVKDIIKIFPKYNKDLKNIKSKTFSSDSSKGAVLMNIAKRIRVLKSNEANTVIKE